MKFFTVLALLATAVAAQQPTSTSSANSQQTKNAYKRASEKTDAEIMEEIISGLSTEEQVDFMIEHLEKEKEAEARQA